MQVCRRKQSNQQQHSVQEHGCSPFFPVYRRLSRQAPRFALRDFSAAAFCSIRARKMCCAIQNVCTGQSILSEMIFCLRPELKKTYYLLIVRIYTYRTENGTASTQNCHSSIFCEQKPEPALEITQGCFRLTSWKYGFSQYIYHRTLRKKLLIRFRELLNCYSKV